MIQQGLKGIATFLGVGALALTMAGQAQAVTFSGAGTNSASGNALSATADFSIVGSNLVVTLTNTGAAARVPTDVLTAIFFQTNLGTLTPVSALLNTGSTVLNRATQPAGGNVGGEWGYLSGSGISSSGLGVFGAPNFHGSNLQGPAALDGLQYGIINGRAANANSPMFSNQLISNSVVFTLSISGTVPTTLTSANFTNVSFQYGTALNEPNVSGNCTSGCVPTRGVPEPSSLLLLGAGLAGAGIWRRKASKV